MRLLYANTKELEKQPLFAHLIVARINPHTKSRNEHLQIYQALEKTLTQKLCSRRQKLGLNG